MSIVLKQDLGVGFILDCELFLGTHDDQRDYHMEMNRLNNKLLKALDRQSLTALDNPYVNMYPQFFSLEKNMNGPWCPPKVSLSLSMQTI